MSQSQFESELEKQIREEIELAKEHFAAGQMKRNAYHQTVGKIRALRSVLDSFTDIRKKINES